MATRGPFRAGQTRWWGMAMRVLTVRWVAELRGGGVGRADAPARWRWRTWTGIWCLLDMAGWNFSRVFEGVANLAVPVVGFVLASRRPGEPCRLAVPGGGAWRWGWVASCPPTGCMPWSRTPDPC